MDKKRALIVVRLSRTTDATTSPERQLAACRELCEKRGYAVVGVADDLDVSAGGPTPFDRPKLGPWLNDRHQDFDVIVMYRMDRLVRRVFDLADMIRWGQTHRVALVSATESFLDLDLDQDAPYAAMIALLMSNVAEMELSAIRERNASAFHHNIRKGKWRGGVPPWGYLPEKNDDGVWRLVQDPAQVTVIHEVVESVLAEVPLRQIAHDLTGRGVLTPKDRFAEVQEREVKRYEWHSSPLKRGLTSRTLLGQIITREPLLDAQGRVQRDAKGHRILGPEIVVVGDDGSPVVRATPVLDRETFDRVGKALEGRENRKEPTVRSSGLLLRIIYCGVCDRPAYRLKGGVGRQPRYRCASAQYKDQCDNRTVVLEWAEKTVEDKILATVGSMERMKRVWEGGTDHARELAEIDAQLVDLVDQLGLGLFTPGTASRARLDGRIRALAARQAELTATPTVAAGWRYVGTGVTVEDWWKAADLNTRNLWLRDAGVKVTWKSSMEKSRTTVDEFEIDLGTGPALDGALLLGPMAGAATLARSLRDRADNAMPEIADVLDDIARRHWREGDPLEDVIAGE